MMKCPKCKNPIREPVVRYACDECHEIHYLVCCPECHEGFEVNECNPE